MEHRDKERAIARICAGYIIYKGMRIYHPNKDINYEAQEVYNEIYETAVAEGILTDDEIFVIMVNQGLWNTEDQSLLDNLPIEIENFKIGIYEALLQSNKRDNIRRHLRRAEEVLSAKLEKRHTYDYMVAEGVAVYARWLFIIERCTWTKSDNRVDWNSLNIMDVLNYYQQTTLEDNAVREIAKTEPWSSLWSIARKNGQIFNQQGIELSIEQRRLIMWSSLYDSIAESPDCPHDTVVEDDDMLDGWLIVQKRKREKSQNKKAGEDKLSDKMANAQEIFLIADNIKDAQKINDMNDAQGKMIRRQRLNQVKKQGRVKFHEFADVKKDVQMAMNREYINRMKGK